MSTRVNPSPAPFKMSERLFVGGCTAVYLLLMGSVAVALTLCGR